MQSNHYTGAGGALEQQLRQQLGLSELDLLKLAASGGFGASGSYTRSHSAEMQRAAVMQPTFAPSWPPGAISDGYDREATAATAMAAGPGGGLGVLPMSPAALLGGASGLSQSPIGAADLSYLAQLGAGSPGGAGSTGGAPSSAAFGEGPRIYVGGVPDLVTVAMVRDHFSRWGVVRDVHFPKERTSRRRRHFCFVTFESLQAAERAVAESDREIGGYPVAAINIPTDRLTHYGLRQVSALSSPTASLRAGLPYGSGSPGGGLPSSLGGGGDAYASPTRSLSYSGVPAMHQNPQVGTHRIRGTTSGEFLPADAAAHLAAANEHDLSAAIAALRLSQVQQQQAVTAAAAAHGFGSTPGSGASTRQPSHDFSAHSGSAYQGGGFSRQSAEYGSLPGGGNLGGGNPTAGSDIYTVLANIQRHSAGATQAQPRGSPGPHMGMLRGGHPASAGTTPLGTPPLGSSFQLPPGHPGGGGGSRPGSAFEASAASGRQQQGMQHPYGYLDQAEQHTRSYSFDALRSSGSGSQQHPLRSASPLAGLQQGGGNGGYPAASTGGGSGSFNPQAMYGCSSQQQQQQFLAMQAQLLQHQQQQPPPPGLPTSLPLPSSRSTSGPIGSAGGSAFVAKSEAAAAAAQSSAALANSFATAGPRTQQPPQQPAGGSESLRPLPSTDEESSSSLDAKMNASVADLLRGSSGSLPPAQQPPSHQASGDSRRSWDGAQGNTQQLEQPPPRDPSPAADDWRDSGSGTPFTNGFAARDLAVRGHSR